MRSSPCLLTLMVVSILLAPAGAQVAFPASVDLSSPVLILQSGHAGFIRALDISPDGKLAVTGADDSTIRVWDVTTARELRHISQGASVRSVAFSPSGRLVAALSYQYVAVWDVISGSMVKSWSYFASNLNFPGGVAFSRDGNDIIVADQGRVFIWRLSSGDLRHVETFSEGFSCFVSKPHTSIVALCQKDIVLLWNTETWKTVRTVGPTAETFGLSAEFQEQYQEMAKQINALGEGTGTGQQVPVAPDPAMILTVDFTSDLRKVVTAHMDGGVRVWDARLGRQLSAFKEETVNAIVVNPLNDMFVTVFSDKLKLWNLESGQPLQEFIASEPLHHGTIMPLYGPVTGSVDAVRYTPNGLVLLQARVQENRLLFWDMRSRKLLRTTQTSLGIPAAYISRDGRYLYTITGDVSKSWDLSTGYDVAGWEQLDAFALDIILSSDGRWVAWGRAAGFEILSTDPARKTKYVLPQCHDSTRLIECDGTSSNLSIVSFTIDGRDLLIEDKGDLVKSMLYGTEPTALYEVRIEDASIIRQLAFPPSGPVIAAFSPARDLIAIAESPSLSQRQVMKPSPTRQIRIFQWKSGHELSSLSFAAMSDSEVAKMALQTREENPENFKNHLEAKIGMEEGLRDAEGVEKIVFSPDGSLLAAGYQFHGVALWNLDNGELILQSGPRMRPDGKHRALPKSLSFSSDSHLLAAGWDDGSISIFDTTSRTELRKWLGHDGIVSSVAFYPDATLLVSAGLDGTIKCWSVRSGLLQLTLTPGLNEHDWATVAPSGLFDGGADGWSRFIWRFGNSVFDTLPIEAYFREYFRPGLLAEMFQRLCPADGSSRCKAPEAPRPLASLNRAQPVVTIRSVQPQAAGSSLVSVSVNVRDIKSSIQTTASGYPMNSGVFDVRLFRDGQMVGEWPEVRAGNKTRATATEEDKEVWRRRHRVQLSASEKATITFHNVRLPERAGVKNVTFTAYAFNSDRVKSLTSPPYEYSLPIDPNMTASRRAYLVTTGVNANQSPNLNLELAVSSAERTRTLLRSKLRQEYQEVVEIPLYSDLHAESNRVRLKAASKVNLRAVLDLLAGRSVDAQLRGEIDPKHEVRAATPDDAVVLYVSSHGYVDPQGTFYLMPYDTGPNWGITEDVLTRCLTKADQSLACKKAQDLLAHSVSSGDLATWWSGVDAGELVMILDSCHSGAVPGRQFRPGPLGDPGFGQLSYDKGMQILSASQPAQTEQGEWVSGGEGRTLLVEALETVAKANPENTLEHWLHDTEQQLPIIVRELYPSLKSEDIQVPLLLDFTKRTSTTAAAQ